MPVLNFKISDNQKYNLIWELLNDKFNEANEWTVSYGICEIYDDYALVVNYEEGIYERAYYEKDDETDSLKITSKERCYVIDVNEVEYNALKVLHQLNNNTYENVDSKFAEIETLNQKISENDTKVEELNATISTLNTERSEAQAQIQNLNESLEEVNAQYSNAQETINSLTSERDTLATYKKNVEDDAKKAIIAGYADSVSEEVLLKYTNALDDYSAEELDIRLTYEQKKAHPELFLANNQPIFIPKDEPVKSGLEEILKRYEKHN